MNRSTLAARVLTASALVVAAACSDGTAPTNTTEAPAPALQGVQAPDPATLVRTIPGFGGFFLDQGVPTYT